MATSSNGREGLARFKKLDVHAVGSEDRMLTHDLPMRMPASGKVTFHVNFETSQPRDIIVGIQNTEHWTGLNSVRKSVDGLGSVEIEYQAEGGLNPESSYQFILQMVPKDGDWKQQIDSSTVVIEEIY
ncbi:hypothetical protein ACFSSA_02200 [Luteolibacter algae]|uniref:Uncharacterized protein n=1 Tax=Luteolibacter algae TaxID=454151 RepID=A0ABW5D462_9BACT